MKVILLCNSLMPEKAEEHGMAVSKPESWINGICQDMKNTAGLEVLYLFPDNKNISFNDGRISFQSYPQKNIDILENEQIVYFGNIIDSFKPDVIHVFGTEYPHSLAMAEACEKNNCLGKVIVSIQGLVSVYAQHYNAFIPYRHMLIPTFRDIIREGIFGSGKKRFETRGVFETELIRKAKNIIGRTDWDEACVKRINPSVNYFFCNETLRAVFYDSPKWQPDTCERYSIFISQAGYPVKGFHLFLQALPEIIKIYPSVHVYTTSIHPVPDTLMKRIKQTRYRRYLSSIILKNNLEDYITFTGYLNETEMCRRFKRSHVFLLPSSIENSPNSLGEAMILGVPSISSDVGGVKNMLVHNEEGYIYPADEPYMIPYYVNKIFSDDELALKLSRNSIAHASQTHNRSANYDRLMNIYNTVSGKSGG